MNGFELGFALLLATGFGLGLLFALHRLTTIGRELEKLRALVKILHTKMTASTFAAGTHAFQSRRANLRVASPDPAEPNVIVHWEPRINEDFSFERLVNTEGAARLDHRIFTQTH